jgi:hypothetical protein
MTTATLKIGRREFVVIPRKEFEQLRRRADLSKEDAVDVSQSVRRLNDPREKRVPWSQVKKRAGLA